MEKETAAYASKELRDAWHDLLVNIGFVSLAEKVANKLERWFPNEP